MLTLPQFLEQVAKQTKEAETSLALFRQEFAKDPLAALTWSGYGAITSAVFVEIAARCREGAKSPKTTAESLYAWLSEALRTCASMTPMNSTSVMHNLERAERIRVYAHLMDIFEGK